MTRRSVGLLLVIVGSAGVCGPNVARKHPEQIPYVGYYSEFRWSAERVLELMEKHPDRYIHMGNLHGRPPGNREWKELKEVIDGVQRRAGERGLDASRMIFSYRADVYKCRAATWPHCGKKCGWSGTWDGPGSAFKHEWIMTVPISVHREIMDRFWGGDPRRDPFDERCRWCWGAHLAREEMTRPNTPERVVALYGRYRDQGPESHLSVQAVVMDLRNPEYRAWAIRRLLVQLREQGLDPGEAALLNISSKSGWHTYHAEDAREPGPKCWVKGSHMWTGPVHRCVLRKGRIPGGPMHYTQYRAGEYEEAFNRFLLEIRAALDQSGYSRVAISTIEAPHYKRAWEVLDPELTHSPWLVGQLGSLIREP